MRLQTSALFLVPLRRKHLSGGRFLLAILFAGFCVFLSQQAPCQDAEHASAPVTSDQAVAPDTTSHSTDAILTSPARTGSNNRQAPESEIIVEGLASYGHYRLLASGTGTHLYAAGFEYDRHSWGRLLGARFDYTAEILPLLLLDAATSYDIWGGPTSTNRKIVPGLAISPIGFRLMWRDKRALKPYLTVKGGMLSFTQKELSNKATYENFTFQPGFGLQVRMNDRIDLRLGLFSDFHFSNGFITPVDPGLDVMNSNIGVSYHLGHASPRNVH